MPTSALQGTNSSVVEAKRKELAAAAAKAAPGPSRGALFYRVTVKVGTATRHRHAWMQSLWPPLLPPPSPRT